jgi:hypothetical protein
MDVSVSFSDVVGTIKMHHTFGGAAPIPRGWLYCSGNAVSQSLYDSVHGTGAYVSDGVNESPIDGRYLPNFDSRYAIGTSTTVATGTTGIPTVGNAGNEIDLRHNHEWLQKTGGADNTFNSAGTATAVTIGSGSGAQIATVSGSNTLGNPPGSMNNDGYTSTGGQRYQDITPDSIYVMFIIKVI